MDGPSGPAPPKPKRQLFGSRPAWACAIESAPKETQDEDVFSRSTQSYKVIMQDLSLIHI